MTTTRPIATLTGARHRKCRCPDCYADHARWTRERHHAIADGTWQPWITDLRPVRDHLAALREQGMSWAQISRVAGIHRDQINQIRTRRNRIRPELAEKILAIRPAFTRAPEYAAVPGRATTRRIKALRAIGWPNETIAAQAHLATRTVNRAMVEDTVAANTAKRIAELYEHLHDQNPAWTGISKDVVARGIRYAQRRAWAPPSAWTDIDADEQPKPRHQWGIHYAKREQGARAAAVIEDTAELVHLGVPRPEIAERIGISWNAIEKAHERAGIPVPVNEKAAA